MASQWFQKARAAAEMQSDRWFVISAHLGLVDPEELVSRYNAYLGDFKQLDNDTGIDRTEWAEVVLDELLRREGAGARVVLVASKLYVEALRPRLEAAGFEVEAPLAGLGIGDQKQYLGWAAGQP